MEKDYLWPAIIISGVVFAVAIVTLIVLAIVGTTKNKYCITVIDKYENNMLVIDSVDSLSIEEKAKSLILEPFIFENNENGKIVPKYVSTSCFCDGHTAYTIKYKFYNTHDTTVFVIRNCRVSHYMYEQLHVNKRYVINGGSDTKLFIRHMEFAIHNKSLNDSTSYRPSPILYMPSQPLWQVTH